jgi:hypothetical protein
MPEYTPLGQEEASDLQKAKAEFLELKKENDLRSEKSRDPHLAAINPEEMTPEEAEIFLAYKKAENMEELEAAAERLRARREELRRAKVSPSSHAAMFIAFVANKITGKMGVLSVKEEWERGRR